MAWYKEWFGHDYMDLYAHRNAEEADSHIDFVERILAKDRPRAVLDLACGAGRHTQALRQRGYRALGIDLSLTLLLQDPSLPRVAGDMRCLPFTEGAFDWVLNFFTSFGYFESERENFRVLAEVMRVLTPNGRFLIDFLNVDYVLAHLREREVSTIAGHAVQIDRWYDSRTRRINKRIRVENAQSPPRTFLESVRAYRQQEVVMGLEWTGLEVTDQYGDFNQEQFSSESPRLILLGRKPA